MEDPEAHLFQSRKGNRIEQMVVRWLRRSRDGSSRGRSSTGDTPSIGPNQYACSMKITLDIKKDLHLDSYGFDISLNPPLTVTAVTAGGPAEGKLLPGDQIFAINNENVENINVQKAADMVRDSGDTVTITFLRGTSSPKSSFLTAEKRAKLKSNPVKVRFAEEVIVNGHTQGNSLLFMPNVLKVYLENGQTKAFKFEKTTTVKDILMTLKEKLSINVIEHFALALEEQYNISKLYLLHEDELIEQVVQKKESHDYRCLFRVCFVPKDPLDLLQEDPVAFEYLYLQSCSDVLQERFAVETKCSVALRLAALHIQERIHSCGQSQKITFKYIEKDWGIDNFLSPTLLRNMRGKDIKKAIGFHMKRNQCILEPRQKPISASQVRLQYLKILGDLKTYGGKIYNATLMLQDRESYVTLLVGAKYGISQIINNKLNIMITLAEFSSISKIELTAESEKVSMVKVYLQDVKPLSLLLESNSAKDIACLIFGYCKLFVSTSTSIFEWPSNNLYHRVSTEEGYESRACSDSEELDSSELDSSQDPSSDLHFLKSRNIKPLQEEDEEEDRENECEIKQNKDNKNSDVKLKYHRDGTINDTDSISENSDSANTESQGYKISWSSDSIDGLEEDDLETCSSSKPEFFQFYTPILKDISTEDQSVFTDNPEQKCKGNACHEQDPLLCFLQQINSREDTSTDLKETSISPKEMGNREDNDLQSFFGCQFTENNVMEYYSLCSVSPASSVDRNIPSSPESNCVKDQIAEAKVQHKVYGHGRKDEVESLILDPPPGFGDSSSEEEFFDATDRFTPTLTSPGSKLENKCSYAGRQVLHGSPVELEKNSTERSKMTKHTRKSTQIRKRRSFLQTDYTTQVTFPFSPLDSLETMDHVCCFEKEPHLPVDSHSPTVSSLKDIEGEPALLETKPLAQNKPIANSKSKAHSPRLMEMEPDTMETKSVTDSVLSSISAIRFRSDSGATERNSNDSLSSYSNTDWNIEEHTGQASPSEISLEIFRNSTDGVILFCPESTDNDEENCLNEATKADNSEKNANIIFKNIFQNDDEKITEEDINSKFTVPPTDRMLPYIAQLEDTKPSIHNFLRADSATTEGEISKESSLKNCKTRKLFGISSATDLLLDFKGLTDLFTNFPITSFKDGTATLPDASPSEEEMHLLANQKLEQFTLDDSPSMIRLSGGKKELSAPCLSSSDTTLDMLKLSCDENEDLIDSDVSTVSSNKGYNGHATYIKRNVSELTSITPRLADSTNLAFKGYEALVIENTSHNYGSDKKKHKTSEVGNCSCQLSYTTCFRSTDNDIEDEIIDFTRSASPLPRTIPPTPVGSLFAENDENPNDASRNNISCLEHFKALGLLRRRIQDSPTGFGKLQDSVLDLQKILEEYKDKLKVHPRDKCAALFSEQKSCLCNVSRMMMSSSQKVLKSDQLAEEIYQGVEETFFGLMQMMEVCLQFSNCVGCNKRQMDLQTNLRDLICTYHQFVQSAKKASESEDRDLHSKLLARQCTALTAAIFCLTQQFRSLVSL
ncbi:FERM and PDZ domain-containing protein 1 isoform X2 [Bufo bufo]|uniref:FERM and PDZ domain-containing protein 1 isoform X2 n=1 Tax=Bufo bufo TaxID=8384 RepID=UPI001ABDF04C|nr:FERM and PDZ domain-containing protein 1 isoform X2 [Bufo bufo]